MSTFLLIHGAGHDGWCWSRLSEVLNGEGHEVVAPDLPCDDSHAGLADYARAATSGIEDTPRDLTVVGHSLGALTAAIVAEQLRAERLVFVAGIIGQPGRSLEQLADVDADRDAPLEDGDFASDDEGRFRFTESGARRALYHDCTEELIVEACTHLRFQRSLWTEPLPIDDWPRARIDSIVCADDRIVRPEWSRRVSRERLGVEPIELPGSHSPMLSRPTELAGALRTI